MLVRLPPSRAALEYVLHGVATVLKVGGRLVISGCREEGIYSTRAHVPEHLFELVDEPTASAASYLTSSNAISSAISSNAPASGSQTAAVLVAKRTANAAERVGVEAFVTQGTIVLPQSLPPPAGHAKAAAAAPVGASASAPHASCSLPQPSSSSSLPWVTLPGLFAGGGLDVMTTILLRTLPPPPVRARVLDFCSGSGTIAAALTLQEV